MTTGEAVRLRAAYDEQLRGAPETLGALAVTRLGPLHLATFQRGFGFITYRDLGAASEHALRQLVQEALAHFMAARDVNRVKWKARGHDLAPRLHEVLIESGFVPGEPQAIMVGEAEKLAVEVPLPEGVTLRRVTTATDVLAMTTLQAEVFGDPDPDVIAEDMLHRLSLHNGVELWVAEHGGRVVTAGRLEPVPGTSFAGIWGGATHERWRGLGIYRALTAARARSALALGKTLINSDSTEYSRPILERSGLLKVSTTTPYRWRR